jgi:apolipoprotein N-acyltransferase
MPTGKVRKESTFTFYTRYGWIAPWLVLAAATICWILLIFPVKNGRRPQEASEEPD